MKTPPPRLLLYPSSPCYPFGNVQNRSCHEPEAALLHYHRRVAPDRLPTDYVTVRFTVVNIVEEWGRRVVEIQVLNDTA
ncbi:MAG: hypothetical protein ACOCV0_05330, partial [Alkalispirochaeta sp.]